MPRKAPSLKAKALQYVTQREHSPAELRRKLLRHLRRQQAQAQAALTPEEYAAELDLQTALQAESLAVSGQQQAEAVDEVLAWLSEQGLLSAARFIESRVHLRAQRFGNRRIVQELAQHGLQLGDETAGDLRQSELARAQAVCHKRFAQPPASLSERARQMRFLAARGFSPEVIRRTVAQVRRDPHDDACLDAAHDPPYDPPYDP